MTTTATVALGIAQARLAELRAALGFEAGVPVGIETPAALAEQAAEIDRLQLAAAAEQQAAMAAAWAVREREVLAAVRVADRELLDWYAAARAALLGLVQVADARTAAIRAHLADPARPADPAGYGPRPDRLVAAGVRLVEVAAGDLVAHLGGAALDACAGLPWRQIRDELTRRSADLRLPAPPPEPPEGVS